MSSGLHRATVAWRRDRPVEQWIAGVAHPRPQRRAQLLLDSPGRRIAGQVALLERVCLQVVKLNHAWPVRRVACRVGAKDGALLDIGRHLHGQVHRSPSGANAVSFEDSKFNLLVNAKWLDSGEDEANVAWARGAFAALQPHMAGGAYVNYLVDEPEERVRAAYGAATYDRLVALKDRYDPDNFFRLNQNIVPSNLQGG